MIIPLTKLTQLDAFKNKNNIKFDIVQKYREMLNEPITVAAFPDEKERMDYVDNRLETYNYWRFIL